MIPSSTSGIALGALTAVRRAAAALAMPTAILAAILAAMLAAMLAAPSGAVRAEPPALSADQPSP
ncbi:MAG: hypothetical protein WCF16_06880, partial [Alphaproteobacteria bacterium]